MQSTYVAASVSDISRSNRNEAVRRTRSRPSLLTSTTNSFKAAEGNLQWTTVQSTRPLWRIPAVHQVRTHAPPSKVGSMGPKTLEPLLSLSKPSYFPFFENHISLLQERLASLSGMAKVSGQGRCGARTRPSDPESRTRSRLPTARTTRHAKSHHSSPTIRKPQPIPSRLSANPRLVITHNKRGATTMGARARPQPGSLQH